MDGNSTATGEQIFHSPQCKCGHKKVLHSGADADGRCVNRSCGCGKYTPIRREQRPLEARIAAALADATAFDGVAEAELNVTPEQRAERRAAESAAEREANPVRKHDPRCLYCEHGPYCLTCAPPASIPDDAYVCGPCREEITRSEIAADPYYRDGAMFGDGA